VRALATFRSARFSARVAALASLVSFFAFPGLEASAATLRTAVMTWPSSRWAYQMASVPIRAKPAIASR
jgi:hypothetical protein